MAIAISKQVPNNSTDLKMSLCPPCSAHPSPPPPRALGRVYLLFTKCSLVAARAPFQLI